MSEIAEAAFQYQMALEKGDKKIVGVNCHERVGDPRPRDPAGLATRSRSSRSASWPSAGPRATRRPSTPRCARMVEVARTDDNMIPAMLEACRVEATLGRDLRRAARRVGRVPRAGPLLSRPREVWRRRSDEDRAMTQQPFSRPGAVDLSALKRPGRRAPGGAGPAGAPARRRAPASYSVNVNEQNFQPRSRRP